MYVVTTESEPSLPRGWSSGQHAARVNAIDLLPRRVRVLLVSEWALSVLPIFEAKRPGDARPRRAVEAARAWTFNPNIDIKNAANDAADAATAATASYTASYTDAYTAAYSAYSAAAAYSAAYTAADASYAAAYAATAAALAAATYSAAYSAANAIDDGNKKWRWLYATYRRALGPAGLTFDPSWRTQDALGLAHAIVESHALDRFPILADALEEAGCDNDEVLSGLREDEGVWTLAEWSLWNLLELGKDAP